MTHRKRVTRAVLLWVLLLSLGGSGLVGAAQSGPGDPLRIVPADALFCLRVNKLMTMLGQVDQFLTGISPVGISMPVRAQLGQFLGQPEPAGLNLAGDIAVFWPLPGGERPEPKRVGILIPLSNFQQFLTNPNVSKPNAAGIVQIGPEGKRELAGLSIGNYLLVTRIADQQALAEAKNWAGASGTASLAQRLSSEELRRAADAPAWVYANVQIVNKMFGAALQQKIKEVQGTLQKMQTPGQPLPFQPQGLVQMWTSMLNDFLQQTQFVSLTLDPSASAIRLAPELVAVPDTEMAKVLGLSGPSQAQANLRGYMENGAITTGVTNFSPELVRTVALWRVDLAATLLGSVMTPDQIAQFRKLALDSADALGGSSAWAFLPALKEKPPFRMHYVAVVRDPQKFNNVLEQASKLMSEGAPAKLGEQFGLKMRFDFKRNVETYQNVPIDAVTIIFQPVDVNSPQGQMIKNVYGAGLNLRLAVTNGLLLYCLSADPEKDIHALIDRARAGGAGQAPSEVQAALQLVPNAEQAEVFGTYNYARLIQMALSFLPVPAPPVEVTSQSNAAFAGDIGGGKLLVNAAIPKQQVLEVVSIFARIQQQQVQERMKQQQQQEPSRKQ
jgi:hypothetical protein